MEYRLRSFVILLLLSLSESGSCSYEEDFDRQFPIVETDSGYTKLCLSREGMETIQRITTPIGAVGVEQILLNCGLNPMEAQSIIENLDFSILHGIVTDSAEIKLNRKFVNEGIHEKGQYTLLDCLSKHSFLHISGEDYQRNSYYEYLTSLFGWDTDILSRRHLADQPNSDVLPTSPPAPAPVLASVSSSDTGVESPSYRSSPSPYPSSSGHKKNNKSSVVVPVVITATVISVLAILLFFCCKRCLGHNNRNADDRPKDEGPLLNLSTGDFSGSSEKSSGMGSTIPKDKVGSQSCNIESIINGRLINLDGSGATPVSDIPSRIPTLSSELSNASSNGIALMQQPLPHLRPPPGRKVAFPSAPSVPPPLAPPPPVHKLKPGPPPPNAAPPPPKAAPPPPKAAPPPFPPQAISKFPRPSSLGSNHSDDESIDACAPKTKLKPLFWDKVSTNSQKSMVWNDIKGGSFQFNEEMIQTLFGYRSDDRGKNLNKGSLSNDSPQYIQLLEPKKSQNLAISLKAMGVKIDDVSDALMEGNELPAELLQSLLRMTPTTDEELRLRLYTGDTFLLGPGEQFLKAILDIPCAFKRMDALLFMTSLQEDVSSIKESFACLEVASKELRSSRLFLKLLEAVLKLGNRMNDGTFRGGAQAFKLDTLLKLSDVKGTDGKTTLLHFVVQEIIRSEGVRAVRMAKEMQSNSSLTTSGLASADQADDFLEESEDHYRNLGLKIVSVLSTDLENVKKAAGMDADALSMAVASLDHQLIKTKEFLNTDMRNMEEESGFHQSLRSFIGHAEADITWLVEEQHKVRSLVKSTTDYFHGNSGRDEGLRLFVIVRDFLGMLDKACKEVRESQIKVVKTERYRDNPALAPIPEPRPKLFPAIRDRRVDSSSSDDEGS